MDKQLEGGNMVNNTRRLGLLAMGVVLPLITLTLVVVLAAGVGHAAANTATVHVDGDGEDSEVCGTVVSPCRTIHYAIASRVDAGGVVSVATGTYVEQVVITQALTLQGAGGGTVIQSPNVLTASFSSGADDNYPIIYVNDADDVIIQDLVVDGAGKGNDHDRFVGVGYHNAGGTVAGVEIKDVRDTPFSGAQHGVGLHVHNDDGTSRIITVSDCDIHGFQKNGLALNADPATPLTVDVRGNRITGRGATTVTAQNGIQVLAPLGNGSVRDNTVESIAYDNAHNPSSYAAAASILNLYADLDITRNTVRAGHVGIYGYDAPGEISRNTLEIEKVGVHGVGIIASDPPHIVPSPLRQGEALEPSLHQLTAHRAADALDVTVSANYVTMAGSDKEGTVGIEADAGYGPDDLNLTVRGNRVTGCGVGIEIQQCESNCDDGVFDSVKVGHNAISGNAIGLRSNVDYLTVDAMDNWWGCNEGPLAGGDGCDPIAGSGSVYANPWLVLGLEADPALVIVGDSAALTADLRHNSQGYDTSSQGTVPENMTIAFTATLGSVTPALAGTTGGVATSTFTAGSMAGSALISATLDSETVTTTVAVEQVDLVLDKTDEVTTTRPGDLLTYTLTITNRSGLDATGVVVTDTLPVSTTFVAGEGWQPADDAGSYIYPLGGLSAGQSAMLSITVRLSRTVSPALSVITNTAQVADDGTQGPRAFARDDDVDLVIVPPDLVITKTNGLTAVMPDQTVTYTLTISNAGKQDATGVVVTDTLPSHTDFVTATQPFNQLDGVVTWSPFDLAAGEGTTRTLSLRLADAPWPAGVKVITNTAVVADDGTYGPDLDATDNIAHDVDAIGVGPNLVILKDDGEPSSELGEVTSYLLSYVNKGTQAARGVVITETVPDQTTYEAGASTPGWQQVRDTDVYTLAVGTLHPGSPGVVIFAVRVNPTLSAGVTSIENVAVIADDGTGGADLNPANNSDNDVNAVSGAPDLAVEKDDGVTVVSPGDVITYLLSISNVGTQGATGVEVSDALPVHTTFVTASHGATLSNGVVTWPSFSLPAPGFTTRTVTVQLPTTIPAGMETMTNTAAVTDDGANGADLDPSNNSGQDVNRVEAAPLLAATKTDGRLEAALGDVLTYILTVKNVGDQGAAGVVMSDTLPAYTDFVGASGDGLFLEGVVTWPPFGLDVGESVERSLTVRVHDVVPDDVEAITNTVVAVGPEGTSDSDVDVNALVRVPDLVMSKTDGRDSAEPGESLTYTITVTNPGTRRATGVVVTDTLPAYTEFVSATAGYTFSASLGTVTWPPFELAVDEVVTLTLTVEVDDTLPSGADPILNVAAATADEGLSASASDVTQLLAAPNLRMSKTDGLTVVGAGEILTYTLIVDNIGTQGATGVVISDTLPAHSAFLSASDGGALTSPTSGLVTWPAFSLPAGDTVQRTLIVRVADAIPAGIEALTNTASVADDGINGPDLNLEDNSDTDVNTLDADPALSMAKDDGRELVWPGEILTYTLTVSNTGTQGATGVVVADTLPAYTEFVSASPGYTADPADGEVTWPPFELAVSEVVTRVVVVRVEDTLPSGVDSIVNAAVATGDEGLSASASDVTPLMAAPDLGVSKTDGRMEVRVGEILTYTLTVENVGTQGATGVVLTDTLPAQTTFQAASHGGSVDAGVVTWPSFSLSVGGVETRTLTVVVDHPWPAGVAPMLTNTASVSDDGTNGDDLDPTNNTATDISDVLQHQIYLPLVVK